MRVRSTRVLFGQGIRDCTAPKTEPPGKLAGNDGPLSSSVDTMDRERGITHPSHQKLNWVIGQLDLVRRQLVERKGKASESAYMSACILCQIIDCVV